MQTREDISETLPSYCAENKPLSEEVEIYVLVNQGPLGSLQDTAPIPMDFI